MHIRDTRSGREFGGRYVTELRNGENTPKDERAQYLRSTKIESFAWTKNRRDCSTKKHRYIGEASEACVLEPPAVVFYSLRITMALCNVQRVYMQYVRQEEPLFKPLVLTYRK